MIGPKRSTWSLSGQWTLSSGSALGKERLQLNGMCSWSVRSGAVWEQSPPPPARRTAHRIMLNLFFSLDKAPGRSRPIYSPTFSLPESMDSLSVKASLNWSVHLIAMKHLADIAEQKREFKQRKFGFSEYFPACSFMGVLWSECSPAQCCPLCGNRMPGCSSLSLRHLAPCLTGVTGTQ